MKPSLYSYSLNLFYNIISLIWTNNLLGGNQIFNYSTHILLNNSVISYFQKFLLCHSTKIYFLSMLGWSEWLFLHTSKNITRIIRRIDRKISMQPEIRWRMLYNFLISPWETFGPLPKLLIRISLCYHVTKVLYLIFLMVILIKYPKISHFNLTIKSDTGKWQSSLSPLTLKMRIWKNVIVIHFWFHVTIFNTQTFIFQIPTSTVNFISP